MNLPKPDATPYTIPQPNNMGMVRYILALSVVAAHFGELCGHHIPWPISSYDAVGGFFALSGFLTAGSYLKKPDPKIFVMHRCRRILPAYWLTVLFFAFILAAASSLPVSAYFSDAGFWKYLGANLSMLNFLHPGLPGVFDGNPETAVNGSLWTMKVEMSLYLTIPLLIPLLTKYNRKTGTILISLYAISAAYRILLINLYDNSGSQIYLILSRQFIGQFMYFACGVLIYYYFTTFMRLKWWILAISLGLMALQDNFWIHYAVTPLCVSALTLLLSMAGKWGTFEGKKDNVSYNIYLVHFPIIQLATQYALPERWGQAAGFITILAATSLLAVIFNKAEKGVWKVWRR